MTDSKRRFILVVCLALVLLLPGLSRAEKFKLRVTADKANIRLKPDAGSMVISSAPLGAMLDSDKQAGEWFRVSLPPDEKGFVITGYVHSSTVEVVSGRPFEAKPAPPPPKPTPPPPRPQPIPPQQSPYQAYQPSPSPGIEFGVKLHGGLSYLLAGDINDALQGTTDYWDDLTYVDVDGEVKPLHMGFDFGGEVIINFMPQIGIGLGVGYIQASSNSTIEDTWSGLAYEDTFNPKVTAIPLTLGVYFGLPMGDTMSVIANAGIGYYLGTFSWNYSYESEYDDYEENWEAKSNAIGFHGGLGIEVNLSPSMALVVEGFGRYAKLKGLTGDYTWEESYFGFSSQGSIKDATLWYYEWRSSSTGKWYPTIAFGQDEPQSTSSRRNIREGEVDLTGFSLRVGIKIKFK